MNMKPLSLADIARVTNGKYVGDESLINTCITGVKRDNREITEGNMFLCIRGEKVDGHNFAPSAYKSGACCCLAERPLENAAGPYILVDSTLEAIKKIGAYYRSLLTIPIIGVTGSVGKTTAKEMTAAVLSEKFAVLKTTGNLNNELGVPLTLLSICEEHEAAVIEMGISEFGEMERLAQMARPDICITTTIGYCHLENLGDLDGVLRAKGEVYKYMSKDGCAVVNGDDEKLRGFDPGIKKITFGFGKSNDYYAENLKNLGFSGVSCDITGPDQRISNALIPAFGNHMVLSALAANAVAKQLGMTDEEICRGFKKYAPVGGRANVSDTGYITVINDCYNANPNSVKASLTSLSSVKCRRVAILGDMNELGANAASLHGDVGALSAKLGIDLLICCGALSRNTYDACKADNGNCLYFENKDLLFKKLPDIIKKGDAVLVKASNSHRFDLVVSALESLK